MANPTRVERRYIRSLTLAYAFATNRDQSHITEELSLRRRTSLRVLPPTKTMAVYYRYKSGVQTFSVPVPAPSVSVADLKSLILRTARHGHGRTRGRGPRETVALYDERTARSTRTAPRLCPAALRCLCAGSPGLPPRQSPSSHPRGRRPKRRRHRIPR
jgi:hypothetical protein